MPRVRDFMVALALGLAVTSPAWAKIPDKPAAPPRPPAMIFYGSYIAVAIIIGAAFVGAFKSAKRTHQD